MTSVLYQPESVVQVNGVKINYDSFGDRNDPPIILIMGLATQMIFWDEDFCQMLAAQRFWVVRFDNRDIGKSSWFDSAPVPSGLTLVANLLFKKAIKSPYLLSDMAKDTLGLMEALGIKKAHLVGASMGGMIAQSMAIQMPQRVSSLTSIMSTTGCRSLPGPKLKFSLQLLGKRPKNDDEFILHGSHLWRRLHGSYYPFEFDKIVELLKQSVQRGFNLAGNTRQLSAILDSPDRTGCLNKLAVPSLVIHGENDPLVPVACGHATAAAIPEAQLRVYQGMGHTIPEELFEDISNDIIEHIQNIK